MPCKRRTVLSALAGGGVAASVGSTAANASTAPTKLEDWTAMEALDRPGGDPSTLEGSVTTAPISAGDRLLLGTDRGCYIFEDEAIGAFVPTRPVRRIVPLGADRAVVLVDDRFFPNVLAVDLASGEIEWRASRTRSMFNQELGRTDRQVPVFDAVGIGEATGNAGDVAVATGYGVVAFDGKNGEELWTLDRDYYTWRLTTRDGTLYATTQDGYVLAIDPGSGSRKWATKAADSYEGNGGTAPRSAWDIAVVGEGPGDLVVTTEDGYIVGLTADGSVAWETQVFEPDRDNMESYYGQIGWRPTMAGGPDRSPDSNYFNLELTVIEADPTRFAVSIHERGPARPERNPGQIALVSAEGDVQWTNESVDLQNVGRVGFNADLDPDSLLVPSPPKNDTQIVTKLGLANGQAGEELSIPAAPTGSRRHVASEMASLGAHGGNVVVAAESGDLVGLDDSGAVSWSVPALRDGVVMADDFTGDGTDDYLVSSRNQLDRRRGIESRSLVLRSGTDGSIVWSRTLGPSQFHEKGGLRGLQPIEGVGSGMDLLAFESPPDQGNRDQIRDLERQIGELQREINRLEREEENRDVDHTEEIQNLESEIQSHLDEIEDLGGRPIAGLVVLSGADGSERVRIPLTIDADGVLEERIVPVSVDTLGTEDGLAIIGGRERVAIANLEAGEVDWWRRYRDEGLWPPVDSRSIQYVAVDGPGEVADIVAVAPNEPAFAIIETNLDGEDLTFERTATFEPNGDQIDPGSIRTLSDLDGDGYQEILCLVNNEETQTHTVVSPGSASVIAGFESENQFASTIRERSAGDTEGLVTFTSDGDTFTATVTEGIEERWREQRDFSRRGRIQGEFRPTAIAGEIDGSEVVALATTAPQGGAWVELYDLASGDRLDTVVLEAFDDRVDPESDALAPARHVQQLPAPEGGDPNLGVIADPTGEGDTRLYVVDPREGQVLVSGDAADGTFVNLDSAVGLLGRDAGLRTVDASSGVTLDAQGGPRVEFAWEFDDDVERVSTLSVGDRPVAITTDRSAAVRLPPGEHTATIESTSPDGFTVYDETTVSVGGGAATDLLLYSAAGVSVLALFGPALAETIRRRVRT